MDSSVIIVTGYGLDCRGSIPDKGKTFFLLQSVMVDSVAHPAFYPIGTEALSPGV
jgi:hypothetical protein